MNQEKIESNLILQDVQKILHFLNNFETFNHSNDSIKVSTPIDTITFRFKNKDLSQSKNEKRKKSIFSNIRDFINDGIEVIGLVNKELKDSSLENAIDNLNVFYNEKLQHNESIKKKLQELKNSASDEIMKKLLSRRYEEVDKNWLIIQMKNDDIIKKDSEYLSLFNEFQTIKDEYDKKYSELQTILNIKIIPFFQKFIFYFNDSNLDKSILELISNIENRLNNNEYVFENFSTVFEAYDCKLPQKKDLIELTINIKNQMAFFESDIENNFASENIGFILKLNNLDDYFSEKKALLFKTLGLQYFDEQKLYEQAIKSKNGILVALLSKIAKSDGVISINESKYISKQIDSFQIKKEKRHIYSKEIINQEKDETSNIQKLCNNLLLFNNVDLKEFVRILVDITKVDNEFHQNQYKILSDIMTYINLSETDIKAFQIEILKIPNEECKKLYEKTYILRLEKEDIENKIEYYEYEAFKNHGEIKFELLSLKKDLSKEFLQEYNNYLKFYNKYKNYTKKYDESLTNYKAYVDSHRLNMLTQIIINYKHDISFLEKDIEELKKNEFYKMSLNFTIVNRTFIHERETLNKELESLKKATESNKIVVSKDNETEKLRNKLKNLEIKFQELIEEKTEYLNNIEEFNIQYNLHLGDLIKTILNLRKEILYKKTIKNQNLKKKFKEDKNTYSDTEQTIEELKNTIVELEEILENINKNDENYDEIKNAYDEIKKELEKLEDELLLQEKEFEKTEEQIKENETFEEEYEEVKSTYEEFNNQYEYIKDKQKDIIKLSDEEKIELKKLWKKACKLCHPDIVTDELREKAHEIMQFLNDAYSKKDILKVKEILSNLENGTIFKTISCDIEDKELLQNKIKEFEQNISDLENEIQNIKQDETFITILELDNWDEYFQELKNQLILEKENLEKESLEILEEKIISPKEKKVSVKKNKTIQECPAFELENYNELTLFIENWIIQELFKQDINVNIVTHLRIKESSKQIASELISNKISNINLPFLITNNGKIENFFINVEYKTFQNINNTEQTKNNNNNKDKYFQELKNQLILEKENLEKEAMEVSKDENKNISEEKEIIVEENKPKNIVIKKEDSEYSKYIQSIENPNFEKIRRYCNNLLNDNQVDDMQEYLANNGKMYKAIIYDALEQFIEKLDGKNISLVDWGCGQGIATMVVLDYIKEKQLDVELNQIILIDDNTTVISRAMSQIEALKQNNIEIITVRSNDISELEKLKNIENNIILNLVVNDKFPIDYLDIDYELFKNAYFMCVSNANKAFVDDIYENISGFTSVENLSIRDAKIGRFDRYERIFKI